MRSKPELELEAVLIGLSHHLEERSRAIREHGRDQPLIALSAVQDIVTTSGTLRHILRQMITGLKEDASDEGSGPSTGLYL